MNLRVLFVRSARLEPEAGGQRALDERLAGENGEGGSCRPVRRHPRLRWLRPARGWIAAGLTMASVVWLAASAELPSLGEAARRASPQLLGLAMLLGVCTIVCKAARWRAFYPASDRPGLGLAVAATAVGQVANWAIPTRLGEVLRVGMVTPESSQDRNASQGVALSVGVLAAEKLTDGGMLLLTVTLLALLGGLPGWLSLSGLVFVAAVSVGAVALALALKRPSPARRFSGKAFRFVLRLLPDRLATLLGHLESIGEGLFAWLTPSVAAQVLLWSLGAWGFGGLINYVVLRGLGMEDGLGASLAVLVTLYGGAAVPSLPGRLGVFQYLCVLALTPFGVDFDRALAFSLALYAVVYLPPIAVGFLSAALVGVVPSTLRRLASTVKR